MKKKFVTVFGSSVPQPGDAEYEYAYQLGKKLAQNNINVCSGGFQGIMDAVSKGAREGGAEAVGVTFDIYNVHASKFLSQEIKCHTLFDRLKNLIEIGDAYIVLQGGTGTLLELALVWEYMNKNMIQTKPFACHSSLWKGIVELMEKQITKEKRRTGLIKCFTDIDECADYIISSF
ncbi:MAG: LOG family protein [Bacteroidetes bacterium]|nr:LOG family protein [Bacteroidota bacterium]